jgi:hypothetical protein
VYYVVSQGGPTAGNGRLTNSPPYVWLPFGYSAGGPGDAPHKVGEIESYAQLPLASIWMLADADQRANPSDLVLFPNPSHVTVRNFVYFDNHVGTRKVGPVGTGWLDPAGVQ